MTPYGCPVPQVVPNILLLLLCDDFAEYYLVPQLCKSLQISIIFGQPHVSQVHPAFPHSPTLAKSYLFVFCTWGLFVRFCLILEFIIWAPLNSKFHESSYSLVCFCVPQSTCICQTISQASWRWQPMKGSIAEGCRAWALEPGWLDLDLSSTN